MPAINKKNNPDIVRERQKATFNVEELTNFLDGGKNKTEERRNLGIIQSFSLV